MIALETEARALPGVQCLPAAAIGERKIGRAAATRYVPAVGHADGFAESQRYRPARYGCRAAVGYRDIYLVESAADIARSRGACVRGGCLARKQHA